jgi:hypothetical protein
MRFSVLAVLALLVGFATSASSQTVQQDSGVAAYNGTYAGVLETSMASRKCSSGNIKTMTIVDGNVTMTYNSHGGLAGTVDPSGAVLASGVYGSSLKARVVGDTVTGDTWNEDCSYKFSLKRAK